MAFALTLVAVPTAASAAPVPPVPTAAGQFYSARGSVADALKIAKGATATVDVTGVAGIPASGVASVALNLAIKGDDTSGEVIVYPSGTTEPVTTAVRFTSDIYRQNLLMVKVGTDGKIKINNDDGAAPVTVYADVHGYTLTGAGATAGSTFVPLKPVRIAKTLSIGANATVPFEPLGKGGIPTTGVTHAVFTLTARSATAGKLTVYPSGSAKPGDTNLDYGVNLYHQNQVFARLGADGKVLINNAGTKAVTVDMDVSGYFANAQAAVAGSVYQPLQPARVVGNVTIAARATYSLAPLGKGGVPATGVSGVALNFTTRNPGAGYGGLRVYPSGTALVESHTVSVLPERFYSGSLTAKLGEDGKLSVYNGTDAAATIWVDVFGYFKTPAGCASGVAPQRARTAAEVPQEEDSRTSALQATPMSPGGLGSIEYTYTDGVGRLMHGHQPDPGVTDSVQWTPIHDIEAFTGTPGLAEQADGRLQVVARNTITSDVWSRTQASRSPASWAPWAAAAPPMASHPALVRHDDTLVTFAVSTGGELWALPQYSPNGAYSSWTKLGLSGLAAGPAPVAVQTKSGLQVFARDTAGTWRTALYARGVLTGCASLPGSGFTGQPAVVVYPGSKLRVFARAADGRIMGTTRDDAGAWQAWQPVGDFIAKGSPAAVLNPSNGLTELVARGPDDVIYAVSETGQNSGQWGNWVDSRDTEHGDHTISMTDPYAFEVTTSEGSLWAFVIRSAGQIHRAYFRRPPPGARSGLVAPGGFTGHTLPAPPRSR